MISVQEAENIILSNLVDFGTETIPLSDSIGRVLKENWHTDRNLPPYDRVTMDGIAIDYSAFEKDQRTYPIEGVAAAGMAQMALTYKSNCLEVMTGSIMPNNADTVIRYEDLTIEDGKATINIDQIKPQQNVHFCGEDRKAGDLVVPINTIISPSEIGVGASIGKSEVQVARLPKIIVISTGDELVEIDQKPLAHQIRRSNVYRIATTLKSFGIHPETDHLLDDKKAIVEKISNYLNNYDAIILSGGVSKGKFDFLPEVLSELGVTKLFHKIKQRPGKPFWFGKYQDKSTIFALPGNPVSSFLCMQRYFMSWLHASLGISSGGMPHAILTNDVSFNPDLTYFLEVKLSYSSDGKIMAIPQKGNGSGDLANLSNADAFIELPRGRNLFNKGEVFPFYRYR